LEKVRAWAGLDVPAGTAGDFLEFRAHGTGAHSAYAYACTSEFSPKRFREACHVSLGSAVNGVTRDRKKTSRGTDIDNSTPAFRDHVRKQMASQRRERDYVYECHLLISHWIARGKRPEIAEPGIIDQKIDIDLITRQRIDQQFDLRFVGKIDNANVDVQVWISVQQFVA
jgi:hypothetical protein